MKKVLIATAIMAAFGAVITPLGMHFATDNLDSEFPILAFIAFLLSVPGLLGLSVLYPVLKVLGNPDTAVLAISGAFSYGVIALFSAGMAWCIRAPLQKARKKRDSGEPSETQP